MKTLGFIETKGFTAAVVAADTALKTANVTLVSTKKDTGDGLVTVILTGDVASVKAAVEAGAQSAAAVGQVVSSQVIAHPHDDLESMITDTPVVSLEKAPAAVVKPVSKAKTPGI